MGGWDKKREVRQCPRLQRADEAWRICASCELSREPKAWLEVEHFIVRHSAMLLRSIDDRCRQCSSLSTRERPDSWSEYELLVTIYQAVHVRSMDTTYRI